MGKQELGAPGPKAATGSDTGTARAGPSGAMAEMWSFGVETLSYRSATPPPGVCMENIKPHK